MCPKCKQNKPKANKNENICVDCKKIRSSNYYKNNKERIQIANKQWVLNNPEKSKEHKSKWNKNNLFYFVMWSKNNCERRAAHSNKYRVKNKPYYAMKRAERRAKQLQATPKWVNKEEEFLIKEAYSLATLRNKVTGIKWEVDHILPLQSNIVCGLHCIANLQVIPRAINRSKNNKICGILGEKDE